MSQPNQPKKWCEICKMLIPYTRAAIVDHENTAKHKKNKEINLRNQNRQARKEKIRQHQPLDTLPQDKRQKKYQKEQNQREVWQQEPEIEYTGENEAKQNEVDDQLAFFGEGKIWILEKEDDTGRLRFRNAITGEIKYEKPIGLILEDYEEEAWEEGQRTYDPSQEKRVKIGQWEVVNEEDRFMNKYKIEESEDEGNEGQGDNQNQEFENELKDKIQKGLIKNQNEFVKEVLTYGEIDKGQTLKQKLIKLAEQDIELDEYVPQIEINKDKKEPQNIKTEGLFTKQVKKKVKVDYF